MVTSHRLALFIVLIAVLSLGTGTGLFRELSPLFATPTLIHARRPQVIIGDSTFSVEVVRGREWQQGLMFREKLAPHEGMLFWGTEEKLQSFWMKNTLISLDMIFISKNLKIVHIAEKTEPLSETSVPSQKPASHILEILGGEARRRGIKVGAQVFFRNLEQEEGLKK